MTTTLSNELTLRKVKPLVKVEVDDFTENPREYAECTTMVCFHKRYNLGDKHDFSSNDFDGWDDFETYLKENNDIVLIEPLSLYDHSGISMSIGKLSGWDCGQVGFIYMTKQQMIACYGDDEIDGIRLRKIMELFKGEVETYNKYLLGEVYSICLYERFSDGEHEVKDMADCIGGFYFDKDYTVTDAIKEHFGLDKEDYDLENDYCYYE